MLTHSCSVGNSLTGTRGPRLRDETSLAQPASHVPSAVLLAPGYCLRTILYSLGTLDGFGRLWLGWLRRKTKIWSLEPALLTLL